ncbi:MAG: hypothetical protein GY861_03400 [bacterium]|nr:hypothetical protein [bacterium]
MTYPPLQYSYMIGKDRARQVVVRAESADELERLMRSVKHIVEGLEKKASGVVEPDSYQKQMAEGNCEKCDAKMAISKKGKAYCSSKCWLK